jgi:hypothetical protein
MANIIGEPFKDYVNSQIEARQEVHGKISDRTIDEIQYLNSRNAWIKMASGITIDKERLGYLKKSNPLITDSMLGKELAMKYILFNGISTVSQTLINDPNDSTKQIQQGTLSQKSGLSDKNSSYDYTSQFKYSPMPGILNADIRCINRGSIKKATINIKVHNKYQLDIIDTLYMRLGYTVMLEWGYDKYWDDKTKSLEKMGPSLIDNEYWQDIYNNTDYSKWLPKIEERRKICRGNYDGMMGMVTNFSWNFNSDGSYDVKIEVISLGDIIESLKVNLPPLSTETDKSLYAQFATNSFGISAEVLEAYRNSQDENFFSLLEKNKSKNRIYNYFYNIRKYYNTLPQSDIEYYTNTGEERFDYTTTKPIPGLSGAG